MSDTVYEGKSGWTGTIQRDERNPQRWYVKVELVFDCRVLRLNLGIHRASGAGAHFLAVGQEMDEWLQAEIAKS